MDQTVQAQLAAIFPETKRRYARCLKKLGYATADEAHQVRRRRQGQVDDVLRVYGPCEDCGLWHLTHSRLLPEQVEAEEQCMHAELQRYRAVSADLKRCGKRMQTLIQREPDADEPIVAFIERLEATVREQWQLYQRAEDLDFAITQRQLSLSCAQAGSSAEAQRLDQQALADLERRSQRAEVMRQLEREHRRQARRWAQAELRKRIHLRPFRWPTAMTR